MNDIYEPGLDERIQSFLKGKAAKYPELHLLDGQGQDSIRPHIKVSEHRPKQHHNFKLLINSF